MTARRMNLFQMGRFPQYLTPSDVTSSVFACVWKARGLLKRFMYQKENGYGRSPASCTPC
jgi:hypothetical protein